MKFVPTHSVTATLIAALCIPAHATAAAQEKEKSGKEFISFKQSELKWKDAPSIGPGAKIAVIEGNPSGKGPFTMRIKAPANTKIGVHTHPADERVTVLDGTFYFALGDKFDVKKATAYNRGDGFIVPEGMSMYGYTKDKPVTLQLNGMGPWGITYSDPKDDPTKTAKK